MEDGQSYRKKMKLMVEKKENKAVKKHKKRNSLDFFDEKMEIIERNNVILGKLDVMGYLRQCSGKKYDRPVSMADWEDSSTKEQEVLDLMRYTDKCIDEENDLEILLAMAYNGTF